MLPTTCPSRMGTYKKLGAASLLTLPGVDTGGTLSSKRPAAVKWNSIALLKKLYASRPHKMRLNISLLDFMSQQNLRDIIARLRCRMRQMRLSQTASILNLPIPVISDLVSPENASLDNRQHKFPSEMKLRQEFLDVISSHLEHIFLGHKWLKARADHIEPL